MRTINVPAARPYDVVVGAGLLDEAGERVRTATGCTAAALVSDDTVDALYGDRAQAALERAGCRVVRFAFPHGEQSKNLEAYGRLLEFLAQSRLSRADTVVALGGGVTGDLAGFAAATYLRGVPLVQMPTTLLAAVDSSVGGKTAVDLPLGKNLAGAFYQPSLVLCDVGTLGTLPREVFRDGCAEVIKYGVLCDRPFFDSLRIPVDEQVEAVIARCVEIKSRIVANDEHDRGERQLLNLGHTIGHAIEQCSQYAVSHGCAVAIGMACVARAAWRSGLCELSCAEELEAMLRRYGLPLKTEFSAETLCRAAMADKKRTGGSITLVLPRAIGDCTLTKIPVEQLVEWIDKGVRPL